MPLDSINTILILSINIVLASKVYIETRPETRFHNLTGATGFPRAHVICHISNRLNVFNDYNGDHRLRSRSDMSNSVNIQDLFHIESMFKVFIFGAWVLFWNKQTYQMFSK